MLMGGDVGVGSVRVRSGQVRSWHLTVSVSSVSSVHMWSKSCQGGSVMLP